MLNCWDGNFDINEDNAVYEARNTGKSYWSSSSKNAYEKTSIQQEMFGVKMLCGKCSCIVNKTSDENSWKAS